MIPLMIAVLAAQGGLLPHAERARVLVFIRSDCPVCNRYAPDLERLYRTYSGRGIDFHLVYPEPGLTRAAMQKHLREYGYTIPALLDPRREYVRSAGVRVTPEAAVFASGRLVYKGRIDDRFVDFGKARASASEHDLQDVLDAILNGKIPAFRETKSIGCAIETLP